MTTLSADKIGKTYTSDEVQLEVLTEASLAVAAGESVAVLGPSGSGKSTLLSILGTLESPTTGTVTLAGTDPFNSPKSSLPPFVPSMLASCSKTTICCRNVRCWKT